MDDQDKVVVRKEEDIRASIIEDLGLDEANDAERIEKLVAREVDHDKKLSSAIGAKIKHRDELNDYKQKNPPQVEKKEEDKGLSQDDVIYVAKAPIHEEDIKDVINYAKKMGVSVKEAHSFFKPILKERDEQRKTAELTHVKGSPRSVTKDTPDTLVARANKGEEIDPSQLASARMQQKIASIK